ncbi:CobW family GTP-binding protein [Mucisphaera sp.]|uniref:CobW family GTP-binding protein n=1 Tax=Mucisphaera sp. TaxID=2913024 RepID=UPI003D0CE05B
MTTESAVPCHIVAGPLGVGKTTAILNYLRRYASHQRVGVLVNDFGPVGLDGATLAAEAPKTKVLNVPGGCICCTMLAELPDCVRRLVSDQSLDRLIIEPSGMASPAQVIDLLRSSQQDLDIRLQPSVVMLNTGDFDEETFETRAYYHMFCEAADILVFNWCDRASESKINRARQWGSKLNPPKLRVLTTSQGELPADVFKDWPTKLEEGQQVCQHEHHHDHSHEHNHSHGHDPKVHPGGFVLEAGRCFDEQQLLINLMRVCHEGIAENEVLRLKGVFHTNGGWQSIEIANREVTFRPSAHRRDNRMEWLTQPGIINQEQMLLEMEKPLDWRGLAESLNIS